MKKKLHQLKENLCIWYFLSVITSGIVCFLLAVFFGNKIQDWMYLRHQDLIPSQWLVVGVCFVSMYNLRYGIETLLRKIFKP